MNTLDTKHCKQCNITKEVLGFRVVRDGLSQYLCSWCKDCERRKALERYHQNKEACQKRNKEYKEAHKDEIKEKRKIYLDKNKEHVSERYRQYCKANRVKINTIVREYYNTNVFEKLRRNFRTRLLQCLHHKEKNTRQYLNAPFDFVAKWIEFGWDSKMSWANYGQYWHIDHVLPISKIDIKNKEEIEICFSWVNLQPLEKKENISKHNKLIDWMVQRQKKRLRAFLEEQQDSLNSHNPAAYIDLYDKMCQNIMNERRCATSSNCGNTLRAS